MTVGTEMASTTFRATSSAAGKGNVQRVCPGDGSLSAGRIGCASFSPSRIGAEYTCAQNRETICLRAAEAASETGMRGMNVGLRRVRRCGHPSPPKGAPNPTYGLNVGHGPAERRHLAGHYLPPGWRRSQDGTGFAQPISVTYRFPAIYLSVALEGLSMHRFRPWNYGMLRAFKHVKTGG